LGSTNVMLMSTEQVGAYVFLLCHSWNIGGLPNDDRVLAHLARIPLELWNEWNELEANNVKAQFYRDDETGLLHNKKLERVRSELGKFKKKLSEAGKRGAKKRWDDNSQANGHPNGSPSPTPTPTVSSTPNPTSENNNNPHTPIPPKGVRCAFMSFFL